MILNAHAGTKYGIPFPVFLPRFVRQRAGELPRSSRAGRVRTVRHPNLDRERDFKILSIFLPSLARVP